MTDDATNNEQGDALRSANRDASREANRDSSRGANIDARREAPRTPQCAALDIALSAYLAGRLDDAEAEALEAHAADCTRCESTLDATTRLPVTSFAPALPPELRSATLSTIGATSMTPGVRPRQSSRASRGWTSAWKIGGSVMTLAAAAAIALMVARREPARAASGDDPVGQVNTAPLVSELKAVQQGAARIASEGAKAEFESLDAAAREIERELQAAPDDRELRSYLSAVRSRRDELEERVRDAAL